MGLWAKLLGKNREKEVIGLAPEAEKAPSKEPIPRTFREVEIEMTRKVFDKVSSKLDELDRLQNIELRLDALCQLDEINEKLDILDIIKTKLDEFDKLDKLDVKDIKDKIQEIRLTLGLQQVYDLVKERGEITTAELAELRGVTTGTASGQLGELVKLGKLVKLDKGKYGHPSDVRDKGILAIGKERKESQS